MLKQYITESQARLSACHNESCAQCKLVTESSEAQTKRALCNKPMAVHTKVAVHGVSILYVCLFNEWTHLCLDVAGARWCRRRQLGEGTASRNCSLWWSGSWCQLHKISGMSNKRICLKPCKVLDITTSWGLCDSSSSTDFRDNLTCLMATR